MAGRVGLLVTLASLVTPGLAPSEPVEGVKPYANTKGHFALAMPEFWTTMEGGRDGQVLVVMHDGMGGAAEPSCVVEVDPADAPSPGDPPFVFTEADARRVVAGMPGVDPANLSVSMLELDGRQAASAEAVVTLMDMTLLMRVLWVPTAQRDYFLICGFGPETAAASRPVIVAIERSFKVGVD